MDSIQSTKTNLLINSGLANDENDAMEKLREFAIQLSSSKVTEVSQSPDLHLIQAINTLDETDKIINSISSRLREWYGLHFPELDNLIDSINGYSQIVLSGKRENISKEDFERAGFSKDKVEMLCLIKEKSRGGDIRCLVVGGKVIGSIKRINKGDDFRSNIHQGGTAEKATLSRKERG